MNGHSVLQSFTMSRLIPIRGAPKLAAAATTTRALSTNEATLATIHTVSSVTPAPNAPARTTPAIETVAALAFRLVQPKVTPATTVPLSSSAATVSRIESPGTSRTNAGLTAIDVAPRALADGSTTFASVHAMPANAQRTRTDAEPC